MLSKEQYYKRYDYNEDEDQYEFIKTVRKLIAELEPYLPIRDEYNKWTDLQIKEDEDNRLWAFDIYQYKYKPYKFIVQDILFSGLMLSGIVSHQMKCIKMRYNDIKNALIETGLDKCIKTKLFIERDYRFNISKNDDYDKEDLPYKYYSNIEVKIEYNIDLSLVPEDYLCLLRMYDVNIDKLKNEMKQYIDRFGDL